VISASLEVASHVASLLAPLEDMNRNSSIGAVTLPGALVDEAIVNVEEDDSEYSNSDSYRVESRGPTRKRASMVKCHYEECPYTINRPQFMVAHLRYHEFERLGSKRVFKCPEDGCGYMAVEHANIGAHRRMHAKVKPFVCGIEGCKHVSSQSNNMRSHQMRAHGWAKISRENRISAQQHVNLPEDPS
jgi:hypothetical protein